MILRGKGRWAIRISLVMGLAAVSTAGWTRLETIAARQALKGNNLTNVRQQALTLFPRGSRLDDAAAHLAGIGFDCEAMTHFAPDISAPSLLCASNGRGYPDYPAVNLTVLTRNGLIADIEVWNVMARADNDIDGIDMMATGTIPRTAVHPRDRRILALP